MSKVKSRVMSSFVDFAEDDDDEVVVVLDVCVFCDGLSLLLLLLVLLSCA